MENSVRAKGGGTKAIEIHNTELGPIEDDIQRIKDIEMQNSDIAPIEQDVQILKADETVNELLTCNRDDDPVVNEPVSLSNEVVLKNDSGVSEVVSSPVFTIAEGGTKRGGRLLLDNRGYSFTVKLVGKHTTNWKCSVRSRVNRCPATVRQTTEGFKEGNQKHNHPPKPRSITRINIVTEIKEISKLRMSDTARNVVTDVIAKHYNADMIAGGLPKTQTLIRLANRARAKYRPNNPKNLKFQLNSQYMPEEFIKADIEHQKQRHILMATIDQLSILADTKIWMIDLTTKFVRFPFTQIMSIHTFVRSEKELTIVPLAFVLMSKQRQRDYKVVLEHLLMLLPHRQSVRKCVLDFDVALWKAILGTIPNTNIQGCSFHWIKRVLKKHPKTTLQAEICTAKKIMGLVFLPPEEIEDAFIRLQKNNKRCQGLFNYVDTHWINSSFWLPEHWSVFGQIIRTAEEVEGWHSKIVEKHKGKGVDLYSLVEQLNGVSTLTLPLNWKLMSEDKLCSLQRLKKHWHQKRLFKLWKKYLKHKISIDDLLNGCTLLDYPMP